MSRLLVAVKSCHRDREAGFHDVIRETWGRDLKNLGVEVRFFMGHNGGPIKGHNAGPAFTMQKDESIVDAADTYEALPHKTRGIAKWSLDRMFDHIFLCDNDTIVNAKELMKLPFEIFDYAGHFKGGQAELGQTFYYKDHAGEYPNCYAWASGGMGYFISKQAATIVADVFPKFWAEDMYVGQCLGPLIQNGTYFGGALEMNRVATWHYRKSPKDPKFTADILRMIYQDGGPEKLYKESDAK